MKIEKILITVLISMILLFSTATSTINKSHTNNENLTTGCKPCLKNLEYSNIEYIDGKYPVLKSFPPKSEFALSLVDPDPELTMSFDSLPNQFSWLDYGGDWTTSAKDQQNCGSCWAFGALGGLEAAINIAKGDPNFDRDLSEQYILSCLSAAGSCNGGWMSEAIAYIQSTSPGSSGNGINGVPREDCMPYQAVDWIPCDDKCDNWDTYHVPPEEDDVLWQVDSFGVTSGSEDDPNYWNLMKTWVMDHGPIIVDIYTGGWANFWSYTHDPNAVYQNDDSGTTNHAQVLCGWVDDPQILNGGYWILKNSWGTGWGYNGFSNIAYGCNSLGTRDVTWVEAIEWPPGPGNNPPADYDLAVFSNFNYASEYSHPGDEIQFTDTSDGDVALRGWNFGDGSTSNQKNPRHTYSQIGEYDVTLTVWNAWGLTSNRTRIVAIKENWLPVIEGLPEEFVGHGLTYHFDSRYSYDPDGTIASCLWDFGDGTTSNEQYLDHTFPAGDVIYEVKLTLTDNDGGSASDTCNLKIDQTVPPVTTILHGIGYSGTDWYKETQRISFYATDWTSVIDTFYLIDGGNWKRYVTSEQQYIPIGTEGEHTVEAYSVDYWNNKENPPVSDTFGIDKTKPTIDVSLSGDQDDNGYYINKVTVTITGDDTLSGIDKLEYFYYLPYVDYMDYTGPFVISNQEARVLYVRAKDNAGNIVETEKIINIKAYNAPTTPAISGPSSGKLGEELSYTFVSYDPGNDISYYIEWGDGNTDGWLGSYDSGEEVVVSHVYTTTGTKYINVKAKNQYDAESNWGTFVVSIPKYKFSDNSFILKLYEKYPVIFHLFNYLFSKL